MKKNEGVCLCQAEDGIRDLVRSRGLGDVYKRQEQGKYATSQAFLKMGMVSGADLTIEAAVTKLMFLLGMYSKNEVVAQHFVQSLAGELTE